MASFMLVSLCVLSLVTTSLSKPINKPESFEVRLLSGPKGQHTADPWELSVSRVALLKFKDYLAPDEITKLFKPDTDHADAVWHAILANSTGGHVPACAHVESNQLDAKSFNAWFSADTGDKHKMTGANPEHYVEEATVTDGVMQVNIIEGWGGTLITRYTIPNYSSKPTQTFVPLLPDYSYQSFGDATLMDGAVFASVRNAFRDRPGGGIEAMLCGWLPDSTPDYIVQGLRQHQAVEFSNWLRFAYRDISTGAWTPPK